MPLTLYYTPASPPCHLVMVTAKALKLDLDLKHIDLMKGENLTPEYIKLNPQHSLPTLVDGDFVLTESRAISRYLVNKYGGGSTLYPVEPRARAVVDQRLDFDFGTLHQRYSDYFYPQLFANAPADETKKKSLEEALTWLNQFLGASKYVAGDQITIADFATVASISTFDISRIDVKAYSNIKRWFELMKSEVVGYEDIIDKDLVGFKQFIDETLKKQSG